MAYNSIVCIKQVPDTAKITADAMTAEGTVNRAALPAIFNPEDLYALEAALGVKERFGGTVTVLSMGPPKAASILRDSLYRGADRAILITDRRAAGSDTLATGYILAKAIETIGSYDMIFCGRQAIDGDTAQVGPQCAEKLGIPQVTYLEEFLNGEADRVRLRRNHGNGWEVVESTLPVLITVVSTPDAVRPWAARRVMKYKKARIPAEVISPEELESLKAKGLLLEQWTMEDIHADFDRCGLAGSPTKVYRIQSVVLTKEGFSKVKPTEDGINGMIHELITDRTLG